MDKNTKDIIDSIDFDALVADALKEEKEKKEKEKKNGAKDHAKNKTVSGSHNAQKTAGKRKDNKTTINENKSDINENTKDNAQGGADASGGLPFDFLETIENIILQWCVDNEIENMRKASALQWGAVCMFVGQYIKNNNILLNKTRTAAQGSRVYDIEKILNLSDLWIYLCQKYSKIPLVNDFIYFSGVSKGFFYGDNGHSKLTSAGGELAKKLNEIQQFALASALTDSKENPTGRIYLTKALHGWNENGGGGFLATDHTEKVNALPDLSVLELPKL